MRKIFSTLLVFGLLMPEMSSAADLRRTTPNDKCFGVLNESYSAAKTNMDGGYTEDCTVRIFFLNDESNIAATGNCMDQLKQKLTDEISEATGEYIYLLGMTDSLASDDYNKNLAAKRVETVDTLLASLPGGNQIKYSYFVSGRVQSDVYHQNDGKTSMPVMRSVCVLVNKDAKPLPPVPPTPPQAVEPVPINIDITHRTASSTTVGIQFSSGKVEDSAVNSVRRNISDVVAKIDSISGRAGLSVWKNKEGGFNTNRLISDSVAGVVLGTAGGLITSHIVKKNQIKGGLEGIHCTVGGQVVADHGDEFVVGIN